MSTCASNASFTSSGAFAGGSSASASRDTSPCESSCGGLGRVVSGAAVVVVWATVVVVSGTVVVGAVVVAAGSVVATVVSGRLVSGEVVSTVGCVSAGGGGMVVGTVEEVVEEVEVVDVELVCVGVLVGGTVSTDVDVGGSDVSPHQDNESKSHKSESAGTENLSMDLPALAVTDTVATQQVPSMGLSSDVPSV